MGWGGFHPARHAARSVHPDDTRLKVGESMPDDSKFRLRSWNHIYAVALKARSALPESAGKADMA